MAQNSSISKKEKRENLEDIIKNGYMTWRTNLKLGIPFLLNSIIGFLVVASFILIAGVTIIFLSSGSLEYIQHRSDLFEPAKSMDPDSPGEFISTLRSFASVIYQYVSSQLVPVMLLFIPLIIILITVLHIISSFFLAGAIGMSKKATETGKTSLSDMIYFGKRKFFALFLASFVLNASIFILVVLFFGIPLIIAIQVPFIGRPLLEFGGNLVTLIAAIISILFVAVPFEIVIGDSGAISGLKKGFGFFRRNKFPVLLLWAFVKSVGEFMSYIIFPATVLVFSMGILFVPIPSELSDLSDISDAPSIISQPTVMSVLVSLPILIVVTIGISIIFLWMIYTVVIAPLTIIWWSRLYINRVDTNKVDTDKIDTNKIEAVPVTSE